MNLDEKNKITVMLVQALLGSVSSNFRMVAISISRSSWKLLFVLETESNSDFEEIGEISGEFDALILGLDKAPKKIEILSQVNSGEIPMLDPADWRLVFRRKED